jgi:hypothetical protein
MTMYRFHRRGDALYGPGMHDPFGHLRVAGDRDPAPWTTAGGPDFDYDAATREQRQAWLTDPRLVERFRRSEPHAEPDYEHMIRMLDLVWECPDDATVNVVGYRCAGCGSSREIATLAARCRDGA